LSPCPAAERPHWQRQPLARYGLNSGLRDFLATEAAALAGSKWQSFREVVYHNPKTGATQPIPRHREINELLAKKILRDLTRNE
jgi:hypothetical protein